MLKDIVTSLIFKGEIMFMSKTFGGRATDGQIVNKANFSRVLEPEDKVLSDKAGPAEHIDLVGIF